ncbi:MAG: NUDIX hydrolase [Ruminococcus sp.]|nr:NUDIX hydrolase [Ruminococcus sp.]
MHLDEKRLSGEQKFDGIVVKLYVDQVELEDGKTTFREVIKHPGGVCVVPVNDKGEIYMVKQFRYPFGRVLTEIPAGKLEYGEDHRTCGLRELREEIGAEAGSFEYLGCLYPTVAYDTEIIHMYLARELSFGDRDLDEGEFIDVIRMPFEEALQKVYDGEFPDAKTQLAILKAAKLMGK